MCETFLIPTKTLLGFIDNLPIEEGHDIGWDIYGPLLSERAPGHGRWDVWTCFVFGMRYILPRVIFLQGKPMVIIRDLCPRRYLRASEEELKESNMLYRALGEPGDSSHESCPRSILKSALLPESIGSPQNVKLMISEDGIVVREQVRHTKICFFIAARLMRFGCRETSRAIHAFTFSRADELSPKICRNFVRVVSSLYTLGVEQHVRGTKPMRNSNSIIRVIFVTMGWEAAPASAPSTSTTWQPEILWCTYADLSMSSSSLQVGAIFKNEKRVSLAL
jgi:hypothetical protein